LGELTPEVPHPKGMIQLHFELSGQALRGTVTLPPGLEGAFVWQGKEQELRAGANGIVEPPQ
jgi:hypothetical protein